VELVVADQGKLGAVLDDASADRDARSVGLGQVGED